MAISLRMTTAGRANRQSKLSWLYAALILLLNATIVKTLFFLGYSSRMESVEASYIGISRYITRNWSDLTWFPFWFTGQPFRIVYQPLLHITVAALATLAREPAPMAYHFVTAVVYCLGPVALFALCLDTTQSRAFALSTSLLYTLFSPLSFIYPAMAVDAGGVLNLRRLQVLVHYGEGSHTTAVAILPLAILLLHRAMTRDQKRWAILSAAVLAVVVMTNWPGSVGLTMAVIAYLISRIGERPRLRWLKFAAICLGGYLLICGWLPPSMVRFVQTNAARSDPPDPASQRLLVLLGAALVCAILHFAIRRARANPWLGFFLYFFVIGGTVIFAYPLFGVRVLPQPHRFELETGMALCGAIAYPAVVAYQWISNKFGRAIVIAGFVAICAFGLVACVNYERVQLQDIDPSGTVEYRMAKAFERLTGTERVFAPGNVSLWLNTFTDVPQVGGCCDNGIPSMAHRMATFVIYTGLNAGDRDAAISTLWLQAYGAHAVGVTGKKSTEPFKPFIHPEKFNAVLRELWRDDDDAIYEVPQHTPGLAHVINPADVIRRQPANGLDTEPLEPYVRAINSAGYPQAAFAWVNQHQARVNAAFSPSQLLSVQISYFAGWHARVNGAERPVSADGLGMLVVDPGCSGPCTVDLSFEDTAELRWMRVIQIVAVVLGIGLLVQSLRRLLSRRH